jgi:hypothetical protein
MVSGQIVRTSTFCMPFAMSARYALYSNQICKNSSWESAKVASTTEAITTPTLDATPTLATAEIVAGAPYQNQTVVIAGNAQIYNP